MENSNNLKILTIDDEFGIRQSIRSYLEDYGFTIFEAQDGEEGIAVFELEHPDLVLLDLHMPRMGGLQVLETLGKIAPDIPVVVASGTGDIKAVVEALRLGAWDYILKPIEDMNVLHHSIRKCLKASRLKIENRAYQERLEDLVRERTLELLQSEQRYKAVFEYTGTAALILESDDTISMVNLRFAELAGMEREAIEGKKKWFEFFAPKDIITLQNHIDARQMLEQENCAPAQYEIKFIDKNNNKKYVYVSLGVIPGTDRQVMSLLDITEKILAEKRWQGLEKQLRKSQKMEAIGTLAGGIAHDLNNILSPVLGYADMIMRTSEFGGNIYRKSEKIQKAALRAADLVSQVLLFNRGGKEKRQIKLHPVIKEVIKLLKGSIPSTIRIIDQVDRNCGAVHADPTQIHQIIMNLCTNAYHAMEESGGELTVGLGQKILSRPDMVDHPNLCQGPGSYLAIKVCDTGCGMTDDVIDRIFDPYFTTKEEGKGTGLGLATAYSIVQSCQGEIRVKSEPGKGTCFTILLPVVNAEDGMENDDPGQCSTMAGSGEKILVVDDDRDIAQMCKEMFELLGYEAIAFFSSLEAMDYFKANHENVDLVVTDQTMPEKTGYRLAMEMLKIKQDLPVILCSGYAGFINQKMAKDAGIKGFLKKPIDIEILSNQVRELLNQESS